MSPADPTTEPDGPRRHADRRSMRVGIARAAVGPVVALGYVIATHAEPARATMGLVIAGMLAILGALALAAGAVVTSRYRFTIQAMGSVLVTVGSASLLHLDGGVTSPLGGAFVFGLLGFAVSVPTRMFVVVCSLGFASYAVVALTGDAGRPGYAVTTMLGVTAVGILCRRYASLLRALRRRLTWVSSIDPLTGCLNRRSFDERLEHELARAAVDPEGGGVTLVRIDLDRFKEVNDTLGHAAGDDLLAWVGRTLAEGVRGHDTVGRIGGDEFAVILAGAGPDAAAAVVDRLRTAVAALTPASFGSATFPGDGDDAAELHTWADHRLYDDKTRREPAPLPTAEDLGCARVGATPEPPAPVVTTERADRARRTVLDFGLLCTVCHLTGLFYVVALAGDVSNRWATAAALATGAVFGSIEIATVDRIVRSRRAGLVIALLSVVEFAAAAIALGLDGGLASPIGFGLICPLAMVAYGTPLPKAAPIIAGVLGAYVAIGVAAGGGDPWYAALYVAGTLMMVAACADMGAAAAEQRRRLSSLARADSLTGVLNRRGFEERFVAAHSEAERTGQGLTLALLDLDGFKQVNDTAGHLAGDELLVWVASTLVELAGVHGEVGRLGGDEFALVLTGPAAGRAGEIDGLIRRALASRALVSIGVADLGPDGDTLEDLYAVADHHLYAEKHAGGAAVPAPVDAPGEPLTAPAAT